MELVINIQLVDSIVAGDVVFQVCKLLQGNSAALSIELWLCGTVLSADPSAFGRNNGLITKLNTRFHCGILFFYMSHRILVMLGLAFVCLKGAIATFGSKLLGVFPSLHLIPPSVDHMHATSDDDS